MSAIVRARRAPEGGGQQGHSYAPHSRTITAGLSIPSRSSGDLSGGAMDLEKTGRAPFYNSRFLKTHNEIVPGSPWCQRSGSTVQPGSTRLAQSTPSSTSHARLSSALRRVAQLESKIMNRKKQVELQKTDLGQKPLDEESSSASSQEPGARGKKYLKSYAATSRNKPLSSACSKEEESIHSPKKNVTVKQQLDLDSDEEEMRELMESSVEFFHGNQNQKIVKCKTPASSGVPSPSHKAGSLTEVAKAAASLNKDSEKNGFGGVNSPPLSAASRNLSVQRKKRAQSPSPMKDSTVKMTLPTTGNSKQSQMSLESDRSEIKSLDELFPEAADAEDSVSSSSSDFRLNVLSLDDLAPGLSSEAAEFKQEGTDIQHTQESHRKPKKDVFLVAKDQPSLQKPDAVPGVNAASEGDSEEPGTEPEISEQLSGVSAGSPRQKQDYLDCDERTVNSEYSEDFERSLSATDRESVPEVSKEHSESCTYSGEHLPSASSPPLAREQGEQVPSVTVRETAVQTVDPPFSYCWPKANPSAVLGPLVGNSYVDPVPVASHVISVDAVEALTAYNPSALVLNAMLKQHLMLTQQFVQNIQHLHLSFVESLEKEKFHYHTLEEAKEYIKNHRSPPLTIKQALKEIQKAEEEKLL